MTQWVSFQREGEKRKRGILVRCEGEHAWVLRGAGTQVRIPKAELMFDEERKG